jgi:hypothetical protein
MFRARRHIVLVASALLLAAAIPRAQSDSADAIDAFSSGDYQRAAEIFNVLAIKSARPDHAAEFFLAMMYENGLGVPADPIRACALYVRASTGSGMALRRASEHLLDALRRTLSQDVFEDCMLYASIGFGHRFRPETFFLEPGHSISWDLKGATITYGGKDTRINEPLAAPGGVFLPLQHTELAVGPSRSTRRHFIEVFLWLPKNDKQDWTLLWRLFEVVHDRLESVATERLTTAAGLEPPVDPTFDVRRFVQLRVDDDGDPEWTVLDGPRAQTVVIEPDAERQATREEARARREAESRVDWTRVVDISRAPTLTYSATDGCGHVFVYGWSTDRTEAISVRADQALLQLSTTPLTFDASIHQSGLEVMLHVYDRPKRSWPFCTDVGMVGPEEVWRITRGTVTIALSSPGASRREPLTYRATIQIAGAEFMSSSGARVTQTQPIMLTAVVGRMVG